MYLDLQRHALKNWMVFTLILTISHSLQVCPSNFLLSSFLRTTSIWGKFGKPVSLGKKQEDLNDFTYDFSVLLLRICSKDVEAKIC